MLTEAELRAYLVRGVTDAEADGDPKLLAARRAWVTRFDEMFPQFTDAERAEVLRTPGGEWAQLAFLGVMRRLAAADPANPDNKRRPIGA